MKLLSRRDLIKSTLKASAASVLWSTLANSTTSATESGKLATFGWVWEGQGLDAPMAPSVYGVGEGAKYFGLKKAIYMYHPNNEAAMEKLRNLEEVVCDITKWASSACGYNCVQLRYDEASTWTGRRRPLEEAKIVGALSLTYHNIKGAFFDDTLSNLKPKQGAISPDYYASIDAELKKANPHLKLWTRVYSKQLYEEDWGGFKTHMDVVSLWIRDSKDLSSLDRHVNRCREVFPNSALVLGCCLWDYSTESPMPLELLKLQWEHVLRYVGAGKIDGYSILGAYFIDSAQEQARWVRDFITAN